MRNTLLARTTTAVLFLAATFTLPLQAQQPHYRLIDMGTFGGPGSAVNIGEDASFSISVVNNGGTLVGWAETSQPDPFTPFCFTGDCYVAHAFRWQSGVRTDLGALVDGVSSLANWVSNNGLIAGVSENGALDPLLPGFPQLRAVLWKNGHITDLGILPGGGYESIANAVNSKGQVIGLAMNAISDPSSLGTGGYPTQTRAFFWENGTMQDLGTLGGTDALAQFINEQGQVAGWSYTTSAPSTCPGFSPVATGSFIWDQRHGMHDLGTLGGTCTLVTGFNNNGIAVGAYVNDQQIQRGFVWQNGTMQDLSASLGGDFLSPTGINDQGTIAGWSYLAGNASYHATLWQGIGNVTDLGAVAGDDCSFATAINAKTQIIGSSLRDGCTFDENSNAFLWDSGSLYDLNALIPPGASLHLLLPIAINDRGEIAGDGSDLSGNWHAFLLVPCVVDCQEVVADTTSAASFGAVRTRPPLARPGVPVRRLFLRDLARQGNGPRLLIDKK